MKPEEIFAMLEETGHSLKDTAYLEAHYLAGGKFQARRWCGGDKWMPCHFPDVLIVALAWLNGWRHGPMGEYRIFPVENTP